MSAAGVRRSLLLLQGRRALAQLGLLQQQQCLMQLPALGLRGGNCCSQQQPHLQQLLHTSAALASPPPDAQQTPSEAPASAATSSSDPGAPPPAASSSSSSSSSTNELQQAASSGLLTSLLSGLTSQQLSAESIGLYYDFNRSLVPEAFQPFHQAFYSPRPSKLQRKGGCRGLQAEFGLSSSSALMWRRSSQELLQALVSGAVPRVHLRGPQGSGKSIALVQLVEWARNNGWIALYVPSAVDLTRGGFFYQRPEDGSFDTIISAQQILKSMADSHGQQLAALRLQLPASTALLQLPAAADALALSTGGADGSTSAAGGGAGKGGKAKKGGQKDGAGAAAAAAVEGSLMQLVAAGLSTDDDAQLAVECVLTLVQELAAASSTGERVLLAVDDYNALYHRSDYGRTLFVTPPSGPAYQYRRAVPIEQLNLARSMRLLERPDLGAARVLVADSSSSRVPGSTAVPHPPGSAYHMPRFSEVETAHALFYYHERGLTGAPPSQRQVSAMRALTNGSATDLRRWCLQVTQTDMGLL